MTTNEIRAEIAELINSGVLNIIKIKTFFKQHRPDANLTTVVKEAKELITETKLILKRGY
jgi:hypothetical protein